MADKQRTAARKQGERLARTPIGGTQSAQADAMDALSLLKSDHEEVSEMIDEFAEADSESAPLRART